jgi:hypothetical protein
MAVAERTINRPARQANAVTRVRVQKMEIREHLDK